MEVPEEPEILLLGLRAEAERSGADAATEAGQGDEDGGEGDEDGQTQDDALADEILGHVARLLLSAVTCRQIVFQYHKTSICQRFVLAPVYH